MTVPVFTPPHPTAVFRVLRQSFRDYVNSGGAAGADIPTVANQAAASALAVSGTVYVSHRERMTPPVQVNVSIKQGTLKGTQTVAVNATSGAFTATIPGGSGAAGAATVQVDGVGTPPFSTQSNSFTLS